MSQIMTIVWNEGAEEPIVVSDGIPGITGFKKNEIAFLEEVLDFLKSKSAALQKEATDYSFH